jgi:hypothetical protein
MSRRCRFLSMLLAVVLMAGLLVVFAPGDGPEAKATLGPLQAVTVGAADFHSGADNAEYTNNGNYLQGLGLFVAPIRFPAETVVLTSVKARYYDYAESGRLCVTLHRLTPAEPLDLEVRVRCSSGRSLDDPKTLSLPAFIRVGGFQTAYLVLGLTENTDDLRLYGATVFYRVVS